MPERLRELAASPVPLDSGRWQIDDDGHRLEEHLGRPSLYLTGGLARVEGPAFADGLVEFSIALTPERAFPGACWRLQDDRSFEAFFLRPHQSGNPDANQYTPAFNGLFGWQLYHGERYTVPLAYRFDEWFRVRIAFVGELAEIFVDALDEPVLVVDGLKREVAGAASASSAAAARTSPTSRTCRSTAQGSSPESHARTSASTA